MGKLIPLSEKTRDQISLAQPEYDRAALSPGIVHVGVGNFHRAHQAWYLHRLMQAGEAHDWAILGAGVRNYDKAMREKLIEQDCLTTLIELDPTSSSAEIIGSMIDYLPIEEGNGALIRAMADPEIRIVSLTVTESGYFVEPSTKGFDAGHEDIQHDVKNPNAPCTVFGAIVAALDLRRQGGLGPFTCLSCDNLQGNGDRMKTTVVELARLIDPELANWIAEQVSFPNSMVDSIAPATGPNELALVHELGIEDAAPVTHEAFRQWVIEDDFCAGRPAWEKVGATFSDDVHSFETMKIRILNAGHQVIANVGEILGLETISGCMAHPLVSAMFRKVQSEEIATTVAPVPGRTPAEYVELIAKRFSNPKIVDTTRRVAFDGSARHPGFVLPIIRDRVDAGATVVGLALVEALWARMCAGVREDGSEIQPNDPLWDTLTARAIEAKENPMIWVNAFQFYDSLKTETRFTDEFQYWLDLIWSDGTEAALKAYLEK